MVQETGLITETVRNAMILVPLTGIHIQNACNIVGDLFLVEKVCHSPGFGRHLNYLVAIAIPVKVQVQITSCAVSNPSFT